MPATRQRAGKDKTEIPRTILRSDKHAQRLLEARKKAKQARKEYARE